MPAVWNSLYCPSEATEPITAALRDSLTADGYTLYNPFSAFPGKSYAETIRLFVAPAAGGWTRVVGAAGEGQSLALSQIAPCLNVGLTDSEALIAAYENGATADLVTAFTPYLKAGRTADDLRAALETQLPPSIQIQQQATGLPFDALPDDVQALATNVDKGAAEKMFSRISGQLMRKVGGQADEARALMQNADALDWNSPGGGRIQAVIDCLTIPANWHEPDFAALSDAYPLYERLRRNPNARAYPGDDQFMAKVPDALAYTPVYGGR